MEVYKHLPDQALLNHLAKVNYLLKKEATIHEM